MRAASRPRFRLLPTVLLTVAILGLPSVVYAWGRSSSSFEVRHVGVSGTKLIPEKQVLRLLREEHRGDNLFTVTASDVKETLASLCYIDRVSVDRDFPDTLRVDVVEHAPAAYGLARGHWYVVTRGGYVVCDVTQPKRKAAQAGAEDPEPSPQPSAAATPPPVDLVTAAAGDAAEIQLGRLLAGPPDPELTLPRVLLPGKPRPGESLNDTGLLASLRVIDALPPRLRKNLGVVERDEHSLTLRFAGGPVALWGDAERTAAKVVALRVVLGRYDSSGKACTFIDVSMPERVLAKPVLK
jgi:hypothetical protein